MIIGVVTHALYVACTGTNTDPTALGVPYDYNIAVRELRGLHYACRLHFSYRLICGWWRYSLMHGDSALKLLLHLLELLPHPSD